MYDDYLPLRRAASILSSRDKWRPADVPLQAVGVASLATLFIGLWFAHNKQEIQCMV